VYGESADISSAYEITDCIQVSVKFLLFGFVLETVVASLMRGAISSDAAIL